MKQKSKTREYIESLLIAALIALFVRGFIVQAFKIPSSSMEPTLLVGDHLLVNRLSYVTKVPFTDTVLLDLGKPARGDVVVFRYPVDRSKDFIKRVIGVEGDVIRIKDKVIYVNGKRMNDPHAHFAEEAVIPGVFSQRDNFGPVTVPKDSYFCMGDNRDRSLDSRFWGFVKKDDLRWERIGKLIR